MKIQLVKQCIVGGKPAKVDGKTIDIDEKEAKVLIASKKAISMEPEKENVEIAISIDPKELESVKKQIEDLQGENEALKKQIEDLQGENETLKKQAGTKKGK